MRRLYRSLTAGVPAQVNLFNPVPFACSIAKIEGYYNGPNPCWLLIFDQPTAPAPSGPSVNNVYTVQLFSNDGFVFTFEDTSLPINVAPWLVLSSAEDRYTAIGGGGVADFQVFLDQNELLLTPTAAQSGSNPFVVVGDLTTTVDSLQVWATATGFKNLQEITWVNAANSKRWLMLFTNDAPVNGDKPFLVIQPKVSDTYDGNTINQIVFGDGGLIPAGVAFGATVQTKGCTLWQSTTGDVLTKSTDNSSVIRAIYTAS